MFLTKNCTSDKEYHKQTVDFFEENEILLRAEESERAIEEGKVFDYDDFLKEIEKWS